VGSDDCSPLIHCALARHRLLRTSGVFGDTHGMWRRSSVLPSYRSFHYVVTYRKTYPCKPLPSPATFFSILLSLLLWPSDL
jgi:hypothetical protein